MRFVISARILAPLATALIFVLGAAGARAALVITEVFEATSGTCKYVEIHNTGASAVNLTSPQISLRRYANGTGTATSIALTGSIPAGGLYLAASSQADLDGVFGTGVVTGSFFNNNINHNGNDAYDLHDGSTVLDAFAPDWIGGALNTTPYSAADGVFFRVRAAYPNNGNWGGASNVAIADGATSPSGFWVRRAFGANNAGATTLATPLALGSDEVPVELSAFSAE